MAFSIFVINISRITKTQYIIVMENKIFKVNIFEVTHDHKIEIRKIFLPWNT